jgi:Putative beta-barrel porin 2
MQIHAGGRKQTRRKMNKIFASVGLVAGVAALPCVHAQDMQATASPKLWNVSGSLRGFYDDNYSVSSNKKGSFGMEVNPSASVNAAFGQTDIGFRYNYGLYYYQQREDTGLNPLDMTHTADLWLDHAFNERWKLNVTDSLNVGQDPQLVQGGAVVRVKGNNLGNQARITLNTDWTKNLSTSLHYGNNLYIYNNNNNTTNSPANPSEAALLNRMEQNVGLDVKWHFAVKTVGYIGYNYNWVRYNGGALVAPDPFSAAPGQLVPHIYYFSSSRDYNAHYGYIGLSQEITPNLSCDLRAGFSMVHMLSGGLAVYVDNVTGWGWPTLLNPNTSIAPYVDMSATYTYRQGSYLQAGYTQNMNSTDVATPNVRTGHLTEYQETSRFYADLTHQITSDLTLMLLGQYAYSSYKDGAYNGNGDDTISASASLNYKLNRHLSAEVGYNFDDLISSIKARGNDRNRVYLGLNASY